MDNNRPIVVCFYRLNIIQGRWPPLILISFSTTGYSMPAGQSEHCQCINQVNTDFFQNNTTNNNTIFIEHTHRNRTCQHGPRSDNAMISTHISVAYAFVCSIKMTPWSASRQADVIPTSWSQRTASIAFHHPVSFVLPRPAERFGRGTPLGG